MKFSEPILGWLYEFRSESRGTESIGVRVMSNGGLDFDEDEFVFTGPVWFVGPRTREGGLRDYLKTVVKSHCVHDGRSALYPTALTDQHQAQMLFDHIVDGRPERSDQLDMYCSQTPEDFLVVLQILMELTETHISVDPDNRGRTNAVPIQRVIDAIKDSRG